jgi:hypothetical protein
VPKPNYQRDKRQRDLARQRKQEEKRQKKVLKDLTANPQPESSVPSTPDQPEPSQVTDLSSK